jgi:hypothetical protein
MTVYLENTDVPDTRTVMEIQDLLARKGAIAVQVEYAGGRVNSLAFQLRVLDQVVPFRLPCRADSVEKILKNSGKRIKKNDTLHDWARRVAWRQILMWVKAQLALIETGMVKAEEVFMPYAMMGGNKTLYDVIVERKFLALPPPAEDGAK